jgi:hypothetical protein
MKILLEDLNPKVGKKDIFNLTVENESLFEISDDNGDRAVNFATTKKSHIQKYSVSTTSINILGRLLMGKPTIELVMF